MEQRLRTIGTAAGELFINQGYARTQVKDIAREIGLSAGMIYLYFQGKRALLHFVLKCAIDPAFPDQEFGGPIGDERFEGLDREIKAVLEANHSAFRAPLTQERLEFPFEQMLSDAFDTISRYGTGCLVMEKNIIDVGALGGYYLDYRRAFFQDILAYLEAYIARGEIRPVPFPELTAQLIVETLAWWGMHVQNDAFERQKDLPTRVAKELCLDHLVHAYRA